MKNEMRKIVAQAECSVVWMEIVVQAERSVVCTEIVVQAERSVVCMEVVVPFDFEEQWICQFVGKKFRLLFGQHLAVLGLSGVS